MLPLARLEGEQKSSAIYMYLFISATLNARRPGCRKARKINGTISSSIPSFLALQPHCFFVNIGTQNVVGNQVELAIRQMMVRRICREARIFDRSADGEMVQTLILIIFNSQYLMDRIIKETADAGAANTVRLGLQV